MAKALLNEEAKLVKEQARVEESAREKVLRERSKVEEQTEDKLRKMREAVRLSPATHAILKSFTAGGMGYHANLVYLTKFSVPDIEYGSTTSVSDSSWCQCSVRTRFWTRSPCIF